MQSKHIVAHSFFHALSVGAYVFIIVQIITGIGQIGPEDAGIIAPITFLMLLVLSVAVVGMLIFGRPLFMYLDGQKREGVSMAIATIAWLALVAAGAVVLVVLRAI